MRRVLRQAQRRHPIRQVRRRGVLKTHTTAKWRRLQVPLLLLKVRMRLVHPRRRRIPAQARRRNRSETRRRVLRRQLGLLQWHLQKQRKRQTPQQLQATPLLPLPIKRERRLLRLQMRLTPLTQQALRLGRRRPPQRRLLVVRPRHPRKRVKRVRPQRQRRVVLPMRTRRK